MVSKINNPIRLLQFIKGNDYYKIISSQSWHTSLIYILKLVPLIGYCSPAMTHTIPFFG